MLPRGDVIQLLSHATVFVCPSVYEPLGIVNLEAMACETPVVATRTGGIPEVVEDGVTGPARPLRAARRRLARAGRPGRLRARHRRAGRRAAREPGAGAGAGPGRAGTSGRAVQLADDRRPDGRALPPAGRLAPRSRRSLRAAHGAALASGSTRGCSRRPVAAVSARSLRASSGRQRARLEPPAPVAGRRARRVHPRLAAEAEHVLRLERSRSSPASRARARSATSAARPGSRPVARRRDGVERAPPAERRVDVVRAGVDDDVLR